MLFTALTLSLLAVDIPLVAETYGEWEGYFMLFDAMMMQQGVSIHEVLLSVALTFAQMFLQLLSYVGVAYLAITISATVLNSRRGRGFLSFALFAPSSTACPSSPGCMFTTPWRPASPFPTLACSCPRFYRARSWWRSPRSSAHGC